MSKAITPQQVLAFFLSPSHKYMAHFFHLQGDEPTVLVQSRHTRSGEVQKAVVQTKRERLYLSDIDTILRKHVKMEGKHTIGEIALGLLSTEVLETLEKNNLNVEQVIQWAKEEATRQISLITVKPVAKKEGKPKLETAKSPQVKTLTKVLREVSPELSAEELGIFLKEMVNNPLVLDKAVATLAEKEAHLGHDPKTGYIRLRMRTPV